MGIAVTAAVWPPAQEGTYANEEKKMCSIYLQVWHEAVGRLTAVSLQNERIQATLAEVGTVVLPYKKDHYQKLLELEGTRVAILRTDSGYEVGEAV